jgi:hypothetical protein
VKRRTSIYGSGKSEFDAQPLQHGCIEVAAIRTFDISAERVGIEAD